MTRRADCDITAPAPVVWALLADVLHWQRWTKAVGTVATWPPGPVHLGQQATVPLRWYTGTTYTWTVTALEPGRSFTWAATGDNNQLLGTTITTTHQISSTPTGCTVEIAMAFTGRLGPLAERLSRGTMNRYLRRLTTDLKSRAETPPLPPPPP